MVTYWTNFARTADPNGPGLPKWPRYEMNGGRVLHLDDTIRDAADSLRRRYEALDTYIQKQRGPMRSRLRPRLPNRRTLTRTTRPATTSTPIGRSCEPSPNSSAGAPPTFQRRRCGSQPDRLRVRAPSSCEGALVVRLELPVSSVDYTGVHLCSLCRAPVAQAFRPVNKSSLWLPPLGGRPTPADLPPEGGSHRRLFTGSSGLPCRARAALKGCAT